MGENHLLIGVGITMRPKPEGLEKERMRILGQHISPFPLSTFYTWCSCKIRSEEQFCRLSNLRVDPSDVDVDDPIANLVLIRY